MSQNYSDIIRTVAERAGVNANQVRQIADLVFDEIIGNTTTYGRVSIPRFGRFLIIETKARKGHNPRTGEEMTVPAKHRIVFRVAKCTKDYVEKNAPYVDEFDDYYEE